MRGLVVAALALFAQLDINGDGFLDQAELRSEQAARASWVAVDRDRDGRIARDEFEPVRQIAEPATRDPIDVLSASDAELRGGYSARRLVGAEVLESDGTPVGTVRDLLVNAGGAVTGLVVQASGPGVERAFRLPWSQASVSADANRIVVAEGGASAGASKSLPPLPLAGEWRATQFFDDVVQLEPGRRYADVEDLILTRWGEVKAIVVEEGARGLQAYAWRAGQGPEPPHERTHIRNLRPFDYGKLDIAPP